MIPVSFQQLDDLPRRRGIISCGVWIASKAEVDQLATDLLTFKLLLHSFDNAGPRFDVRVESFFVPSKDVRCKAIEAAVRASSINVYCVVAVFFGLAFRFIDRSKISLPFFFLILNRPFRSFSETTTE